MIRRYSKYVKGLFWEGEVKCYLCDCEIDLSLPHFFNIDGKNIHNPLSFSEDHILAQVNGGLNINENISPTHSFCNSSKGRKDISSIDSNYLKRIVLNLIDAIGCESFVTINLVECATCGVSFYGEYARIILYGKRYCSQECHYKGLTKKEDKMCAHCGNNFTVIPSKNSNDRGKFCSIQCYSAHGEDRILKTCEECHRNYYISKNNNRSKVNLYCSKCRRMK